MVLDAVLLVLGIQPTPPSIVPVIEPDLKTAVHPVVGRLTEATGPRRTHDPAA